MVSLSVFSVSPNILVLRYNVNAESLHVLYLTLIAAIKYEEIFDTYIIKMRLYIKFKMSLFEAYENK